MAAFSLTLAAGSVELKRAQGQIDVSISGKPFSSYYFAPDTAKPYLTVLRTPSGIVVTRPNPPLVIASGERPDEPHQRPLYFAHGDIDGLDFWQEAIYDRFYRDHGKQAYGHMALINIEETAGAADQAGIRARFKLLDPNDRLIGEETQSYKFHGNSRANIVDCEFVIHAVAGPIVMGDTKEGTFGIRLAAGLSAPHDHMRNSRGGHGEAAIWGKPAEWVDYSGTVAGKPVGIAVFDSPASFRHPTTWHARAYGLFAANPFGAREFTKDKNQDGSWTIAEGESLNFRYRVVIYDGNMSAAELDAMYREYAAEK